ncbi:MAG TPA: right-handed parallel beta-helix repeat-containing protein [Bryobacteraceae bacterium]|nr:right-handed parallel beta-helix repeat-containing protein [Bryobacteraceae bacterium]
MILPAGTVELTSELKVPRKAHDLEIRGADGGTVIRASERFRGRALFVVESAARIRVRNITVDGNRAALAKPAGLPPYDVPFVQFTETNGILAEDVEGLVVEGVRFREIAGFAILVARSREVAIEDVEVERSGSRNDKGRNNTTGGILLEEGTSGFRVENCSFRSVLGNGVWTHSLYPSPRNVDGLIRGNRFDTIGRDAIQVGHATKIRVEQNTGRRIGFPLEVVDIEGGGTPVGVDTAGNVDRSVYIGNHFEEVNGKCIDLDGFHHGQVTRNICVNRGKAEDYPSGNFGIAMNNTNPDMESEEILVADNEIDGGKFGGIFAIGRNHRIIRNRMRNLNLARCNETAAVFGCLYLPDEPDFLRSGIYLARRAERPAIARGIVIEDNLITGYNMKTRCIGAAPGVSRKGNRISRNDCRDEVPRR